MLQVRLTPNQTALWLKNPVLTGQTAAGKYQLPLSDQTKYRDAVAKLPESLGPIAIRRPDGNLLAVLRPKSSRPTKPCQAIVKSSNKPDLQVPTPEACHCAAYAGRAEGKHHPICEYKGAWDRVANGLGPLIIVDIATNFPLRLASTQEIQHYEETLSPVVEIGGRRYGIVEASPAEKRKDGSPS